jgi:hypothetical protein
VALQGREAELALIAQAMDDPAVAGMVVAGEAGVEAATRRRPRARQCARWSPRRPGGRQTQQRPRQPTAWDSVATPPATADPLAPLHPFNPLVALLDDLLSWPTIPSVTEQGASTPLGDLEELDDPGCCRWSCPA